MHEKQQQQMMRIKNRAPQYQPIGCNQAVAPIFKIVTGVCKEYLHKCEDPVIHNVLRQSCLSDGTILN